MSEPARAAPSYDPSRAEKIRDLLRRVADPSGFVPFDRFMDVALYGEGVGFYARGGSPFGARGDYYTASHASPLFGRTIAERIRTLAASAAGTEPFRIVELGPGDGTLGEEVVATLARNGATHGALEYVLVDRSPSLLTEAFARISAAGTAAGIRVIGSGGVGADGPFHGVVLANEVLDAQPARRLRWTGREWQELGIRVTEHGLVPEVAPLVSAVPAPEPPRPEAAGLVYEFSPMAEAILREVADHLVGGLFLVLDFGMSESELLSAHPLGTLASIRRHHAQDDPLLRPGDADLSVFVNFTRVRAVARAAGLTEVAFRRQAEALGTWGFPRLLEQEIRSVRLPEEEVRVRLAAKNLLFGFERFYALELAPPTRGARPTAVT